ncbi:uncharacterized protein PHALS_12940 [Plasmopara halstedii]|uniref:Uncharacterized protein n=1 Tax=Plasmopara halstedii TaxID=4781 RepID=A0A0P1AMS0_PLAHL|nr:uncharacterized protein PHALS_12940 [Plasmopara halstedii]CEG42686.1 hypothetical protein PHALS_12940 [Plasmopara halstedii]|eukprot:XP_024579055.1 hypothetical protein PHALS_12940 [Plasmopara halstedii]
MQMHHTLLLFLHIAPTIALIPNLTQDNDHHNNTIYSLPSNGVISTKSLYQSRVYTTVAFKKSISANNTSAIDTSHTTDNENEERWIGDALLHSLRDMIYKLALKLNVSPRFMYYLMGVGFTHLHFRNVRSNVMSWLHYVKGHSLRNPSTKESLYHSESKLYGLLRKANPDNNLAAFFRLLRKSPQHLELGHKMEKFMASRTSTGASMRQAWLRAGDSPHDLFFYLHLENEVELIDNQIITEWLLYCNMHRDMVKREFIQDEVFHDQVINLLKTTKSNQDLERVFQSLYKIEGMEDYADEMAGAVRRLKETQTWLKARKHPNDAYHSLNLHIEPLSDNIKFIQWLRYVNMYMTLPDTSPFTVLSALDIVLREGDGDYKLAALFQLIQEIPNLRELAQKMQFQLFKRWAVNDTISPLALCKMSEICATKIPKLGKYNVEVSSVAAYIKVYIKFRRQEDLLNEVMPMLDKDDVYGAAYLLAKEKLD